jgi:tetratricopeptide (TPR) repeat protein
MNIKSCLLISFLLIPSLLFPQQGYDRNHLTLLFQQQQFAKAITYLKGIDTTQAALNITRWRNDLAYAYLHNEQETEAMTLYLNNHSAAPADLESNIYLAQLYTVQKKVNEALIHIHLLVNEQPTNVPFLQKAGLLYYQKNAFDSAFLYYSKAFELNPASGNLALGLANVLEQLKQMHEATNVIRNFLLTDSTHQGVISKWIEINFNNEAHDTVIKWGNILWSDSVLLINPYIRLAYSYLYQNKFKQAISVCQWMEQKNLHTLASSYCEAQAYKGLKDYTRSNLILDQCISQTIQKEANIYLQAKASNYELMKDYKTAMHYYDTAYYIFKNPVDVYLSGRLADHYLNNKTKATAMYRLYQQLKPVPENGKEQLILKYIKEYLAPQVKK